MPRLISKIIYSAAPLSLFMVPLAVNAQDSEKTIIVSGKTLEQTLAAVQDCLARDCPPNEDIDASLAHAENLFIAGDYKQSNLTIQSAIRRNKKQADAFPIDVSDLYRSYGRVSEHLGEFRDSKLAVLDMRDTLKKHLPDDNKRLLAAEIEVANSRFKQGFFKEAKRKYRKIRDEALELGLTDIAGVAKIRELSLEMNRATALKEIYFVNKAREEINEFLSESADNDQFSLAAMILLARLDRGLGIQNSTDALIERLVETNETNRPILLSSDPISVDFGKRSRGIRNDRNSLTNFNSESANTISFEDRWVDIGFWVDENGKVDDAEILRLSGNDNWTDNVLESLKTRIYAPRKNVETGASLGQYVIERYTLTSDFTVNTGSRIRSRDGSPVIRRLDLTVYDEPAEQDAS